MHDSAICSESTCRPPNTLEVSAGDVPDATANPSIKIFSKLEMTRSGL